MEKKIEVAHEGIRKSEWTAIDVGKLNKDSKLALEKLEEEGVLEIRRVRGFQMADDKYGSKYTAFC